MAGAQPGTAGLVGRVAELERCDRFIERVLVGRGTLLLISGEAGIGKTALVAEISARASAHGAAVAIGLSPPVSLARCDPLDGTPGHACLRRRRR